MQNTSLTLDQEPNMLMYGTPSYVFMYRRFRRLKMVSLFGLPCRTWYGAVFSTKNCSLLI